jgi:hypothetical protein
MANRPRSCYYLLYKLVSSPLLWIILVSDDKYILYDRIENFKSNYEQYYIIKRYVTDLEEQLNTERFILFKKNKYDIIIYTTKISYERSITSTRSKNYYKI